MLVQRSIEDEIAVWRGGNRYQRKQFGRYRIDAAGGDLIARDRLLRYRIDELPRDRGETAASLCWGEHKRCIACRDVAGLRALVRPEEEQLVLYDRTADTAAE